MVNRMGPRTDPCGTPYFNSCGSDVDFLIWTVWVRPVRYDWNQSKTLPLIPNDDSSVWSKRWWSIVSNAALRSKLLSFFWLTYYCSIGLCFSVRVYLSLFRSTCKLIQSLFLQWFVPKKASVPKKADKLNLSLSWIFKVKFWKSHIRNGMAVDMELKGYESIECWTHVVTVTVPLTHDLHLGFSRSNFEKVISYEWDGRLTWNEMGVSR